MKLSFRWYGPHDSVEIRNIRQIPRMKGIVTALSDIPIGDVWSRDAITERKNYIERHGMEWAVIESLPVHEEIKWGGPRRDELIDAYRQSLHNIGAAGIPVVCYNFMPVCDWMRTALQDQFPDGSTGLSYHHEDMRSLSLLEAADWNMPAWTSFSKPEITRLHKIFSSLSEQDLRNNLRYFLQSIIPAAEQSGVKMAIHPDDPPWAIFGLPRIVKNKEDLQAIMAMVESEWNGLTFCTGSLGASGENNLVEMIEYFGSRKRIHFAHTRNVEVSAAKNFREVAHAERSAQAVDVAKIIRAYKRVGFEGPMRPDHGRTIWNENHAFAGYGLYDRALGAMYLQGLWDAG